jgi:hypothetical protein
VLIAQAVGMEYDQIIAEIMVGVLRRMSEKRREGREFEREAKEAKEAKLAETEKGERGRQGREARSGREAPADQADRGPRPGRRQRQRQHVSSRPAQPHLTPRRGSLLGSSARTQDETRLEIHEHGGRVSDLLGISAPVRVRPLDEVTTSLPGKSLDRSPGPGHP